MAKPRVFVSSTFFDFRQIRADIDNFLRQLGFESVLFEQGSIPYSHEHALESSIHSEVDRCDMLVGIIGNRLGSQSALTDASITQNEIKKAIEFDRPVFIFIERDTLAEFRTWERNRHIKNIVFSHADDPKIYEFIHEIYQMKRNNPVFPFQYAGDIVDILRSQFAGLFQDLLSRRGNKNSLDLVASLKDLASSLDTIVQSLAKNSLDSQYLVDNVLLVNHPIFSILRSRTETKYRIYFTNLEEMEEWLSARQWKSVPFPEDENYHEYFRDYGSKGSGWLQIAKILFDNSGKLKPIPHNAWQEDAIKLTITPKAAVKKTILDDDIPF